MEKERFETLVAEAVRDLPEEFLNILENVDVVVEDRPSSSQLSRLEKRQGYTLFGLYEGVPLTRRGSHYGNVLPDKITIFQSPIESQCRNESEITRMVQRVVRHEIAHHFGISDARLEQLENTQDQSSR
jgi:predicted Zn-dependent protease with MMP-like domain